MAGTNEQKLREHLSSSRVWQVFTAEFQWSQGEKALQKVADAIEGARPLAKRNLGRHTADQADRAFVAMHAKVKERQEQLKKGAEALGEAKAAISRAEAVVRGFDADGPITEPTPPEWSDDEIDQIRQLKVHGARMTSYNNAVAEREQAAMSAIQDVDATNQSSTATMREIQGKRPEDTGGGGGGGGTGGDGGGLPPGTGATPPRYDDPPTYDPPTNPTYDPPTGGTVDPPTYDPPTYDPPTNPTYDPPTGGTVDPPTYDPPTFDPPTGGTVDPPNGETGPGQPPVLTTPPSGSFSGMAGAVGGGLAGGAIGMGAIRAGALGGVGSTSAAGARPIGSTARTGASGALGRSAAAGGTATRGTAGRGGSAGAGAGRGAGGRGAGGRGAGGRGAGGRGAGGAGGRGGRKGKDDKPAEVDHLLDDHDWIDDEDGAPGVID
jgi:hypothetical protein